MLELRRVMLVAAAAVLCACVSSTPDGDRPEKVEAKPAVFAERATSSALHRSWTKRFEAPGLLVADRIRIEGPADLLQHVGITQEPELFTYETRTIPDGLLQSVVRRADATGLGEIRAQLDGWTMVAILKLEVLQRPGDGPVRVFADGQAAWIPSEGDAERAARLEFVGEHRISR